ncbi:hypothetical protein E2C01_038900 [Portunus trituberculatus]|uniref:Uncharacterized protein n=1 Tax=Portunus trituberculatus TaxID=210409 RepID=A0A5B7FJR6_PORTR|nr:hypothetical protein [Portunus trituberculatus]
MPAAPQGGHHVTPRAKCQQMAPPAVTDGLEYEAITSRTNNDTQSISNDETHRSPGEPMQ